MNQLLNDVVRWINGNNKEVIIKISGHGAAGKSTFANELQNVLQQNVNILETDPYIIDSEIQWKKSHIIWVFRLNSRLKRWQKLI